ncbi:MAG: MiaB/RimO family radical SAM methylthiotransferase [Sphaerochaetaceae bacterium]
MNGCNNFCTYCIVPYVRGREVSRSANSIYDEIARLEDLGVKEITLLGQNVNSYHYEQKGTLLRFPDLLDAIANKVSSVKWIRFESPHPKDFSPELIQVIGSHPTIAKHLHIPLQSGSTRILELMNRRYTAESYLKLLESIRKTDPTVTFTTDVMVGFPQESEDDYQQTLDVMTEVQFLEAFMYYFNPREGTKAVSMDGQIPSEIRMQRLQQLIDTQRSISASLKQKRCNRVVEVLVESVSKKSSEEYLGRTEHAEMVVFKPQAGVAIGDFVQVELSNVVGNTYTATQL